MNFNGVNALIATEGMPKESGDKLVELDMDQLKAKQFSALLTVVQALARPLQAGENRASLVRKCHGVLQRREMWCYVPPSLKQRAEPYITERSPA